MSVYVLSADALPVVKIGHSADPESRLMQIQPMSPDKLSLVLILPGERFAEVELHRRFAHLRSHGEWFKAEPELMAWLLSERHTVGELQDLIDHLTDIIKARTEHAA